MTDRVGVKGEGGRGKVSICRKDKNVCINKN